MHTRKAATHWKVEYAVHVNLLLRVEGYNRGKWLLLQLRGLCDQHISLYRMYHVVVMIQLVFYHWDVLLLLERFTYKYNNNIRYIY